MTRTLLADFPGWPPSGVALDFTEHQNLVNEIIARILTMPTTYTGDAGQIVAVNDSGTGLVLAETLASNSLSMAQKEVYRFKNKLVTITSSTSLKDDAHCGAMLVCTNSSAATLSMTVTGNPATGVSAGFRCQILRANVANTVALSLTGITNRNPNSHLKVTANRIADVLLIGTDLYFNGYTEA